MDGYFFKTVVDALKFVRWECNIVLGIEILRNFCLVLGVETYLLGMYVQYFGC